MHARESAAMHLATRQRSRDSFRDAVGHSLPELQLQRTYAAALALTGDFLRLDPGWLNPRRIPIRQWRKRRQQLVAQIFVQNPGNSRAVAKIDSQFVCFQNTAVGKMPTIRRVDISRLDTPRQAAQNEHRKQRQNYGDCGRPGKPCNHFISPSKRRQRSAKSS